MPFAIDDNLFMEAFRLVKVLKSIADTSSLRQYFIGAEETYHWLEGRHREMLPLKIIRNNRERRISDGVECGSEIRVLDAVCVRLKP